MTSKRTYSNSSSYRLPIWVGLIALLGAAGSASAEKVPKDKSLMPEGEGELVGKHPVDVTVEHYKPGKGLVVKSRDDKFRLATRLRVQLLTTVENESGAPAEVGMILRRARLQFVGNTFGKHNKFKAELAFSPRDLRMKALGSNNVLRETPLLTWYVEFDQLRDLTVRAGQYKIPFSRQRVISSGNQQMVDRSIANGEFNLDRDIGFDIRSKDLFGLGHFKYALGIYNGEGRSAYTNGDTSLLYLGRFEYLPFGLFKDYSEGDFERLAKPGVSIGVGAAYAPNAQGTRLNHNGSPDDGGTTDVRTLTADVTFKYQGLALSSEFFWRDGDRNSGSAVDDMGLPIATENARNGIGWFVQAGYLLPRRPIEITGRFGQIRGADVSSIGTSNEAGIATSYYFAHHAFKLQADAFQLWDSGIGDGTTRVRVQMQLAF